MNALDLRAEMVEPVLMESTPIHVNVRQGLWAQTASWSTTLVPINLVKMKPLVTE